MIWTSSRRHRIRARGFAVPVALVLLSGCGSAVTSFVNPDVDFTHVQRVAVVPFRNLTTDELADERMESIFLMELVRANVLQIVEPRETAEAMAAAGIPTSAALTPEQTVALGKRLGVEALFFGSIEEYGYGQGDRRRGPQITGAFGMAETETGVVIWRSQVHATGASFWKKLFGGGTADLYTVSRKVVRKALGTLL